MMLVKTQNSTMLNYAIKHYSKADARSGNGDHYQLYLTNIGPVYNRNAMSSSLESWA
jgi:hypothetical protein